MTPLVSPQHPGQDGRDGVAHAGEVDLDVPVEDVGVPVRRVHLLPVARGQHREVDRAQLLADSCGGGRDGGGVGDVGGEDEHVPAGTPRGAAPSRRAEIATVAPRRSEFACHGGADSAGSADDPGDLAVQIHAGSLVSWSWLTPEVAAAEAGLASRRGRTPTCGGRSRRSPGRGCGATGRGSVPATGAGSGRSAAASSRCRVTRSVVWAARMSSIACRDGMMPPGKMYFWIQLKLRRVARKRSWAMVMAWMADPAAGSEEPVKGGEVGGPVGLPDGLDHLDADDGVVLAVDLAVVLHAHLDEPGQAGGLPPAHGPAASARGTG